MSNSHFRIRDDFPAATYDAWRALVEADLGGTPFERKLVTRTYDGLEIQPLYTASDRPHADDPSGFPGAMPYTRGSSPAIPSAAPELAQERLESDRDTLHACIVDDVTHGVGRVHLRFDEAVRRGFDGDEDGAEPFVGSDGACLYTTDDLDAAFEGVALETIAVSLDAGAHALPAAAAMVALWRRRNIAPEQRRGAFNADPLGVWAAEGSLPHPCTVAYDQMAELAQWTAHTLPGVTALRVGTAPYHHAGATTTQDLGFSLATAVEYLRELEARGLPPTQAAPQILFHMAIGTQLFLAIAKLRAARMLWARVLEACGVPEPERGQRMHVATSKRVLTTRDPWVNILRNTTCCVAGVLGGAQILSSTPFDAALGLPNALGRRLARNTPIVLLEESHLGRVADPAGGSWMIEHLTEALAERAWGQFQEVEAQGGMRCALESGWIAAQIDSAFEARQRNIATRRDPIIGVSEFPNLDEAPLEPVHVDPEELRVQVVERLRLHRPRTDPDALRALREHSSGPTGTAGMEALVTASLAGATLGQLAAALASQAPVTLPAPLTLRPLAEPFEALRDAADGMLAQSGSRPRVFLANLGALAQHAARSSFSRNVFEAGGFEVLESESTEDPDVLFHGLQRSAAHTAVLCASDPVYATLAAPAAAALRRAGARTIILAGHPGAQEATYREAGIDRFIHLRCDVVAVLRDMLREEGVRR